MRTENKRMSDEAATEANRREKEVLERLKYDLKNNRLVIIIDAEMILSATVNISGKPFSRIIWTGLIQNGLDYLISNKHMDRSNRRIKRIYKNFENSDTDNLLDAANILKSQLAQLGQFPI
jgi:hypothetical protein